MDDMSLYMQGSRTSSSGASLYNSNDGSTEMLIAAMDGVALRLHRPIA